MIDIRIYRFAVGDKIWVRDAGHNLNGRGGYTIVEATVREQHYHPDRHPFCWNGEAYALDGCLWWDCYPGCRVFGTRDKALRARVSTMGMGLEVEQ